jgi:hypothetical protein
LFIFGPIWEVLEGLGIKNVVIFYCHLVHFTAIWCILLTLGRCILLPFGAFCGNVVYFVVNWSMFDILVCCTKKNLATLAARFNDCAQIFYSDMKNALA